MLLRRLLPLAGLLHLILGDTGAVTGPVAREGWNYRGEIQ